MEAGPPRTTARDCPYASTHTDLARVGAEPRPFLVADLRRGVKKKGLGVPGGGPSRLAPTQDNRKGLSLRAYAHRSGSRPVLRPPRTTARDCPYARTHTDLARVGAEPRPFLVADLRRGVKKKGLGVPGGGPSRLAPTLDNRKGLSLREYTHRPGSRPVLRPPRTTARDCPYARTHTDLARVPSCAHPGQPQGIVPTRVRTPIWLASRLAPTQDNCKGLSLRAYAHRSGSRRGRAKTFFGGRPAAWGEEKRSWRPWRRPVSPCTHPGQPHEIVPTRVHTPTWLACQGRRSIIIAFAIPPPSHIV